MTRLTFVRHGQSVANADGVTMEHALTDPALAAWRGASDILVIDVTRHGWNQSRKSVTPAEVGYSGWRMDFRVARMEMRVE